MKLFNKNSEVAVGKVLSPHGVGGQVKVYPYSDFPERVTLLKEVDLVSESGRESITVEQGSLYGRFWLVKFAGINNREDAARLCGSLIVIAKDDRLPLPKGSFYHDQLVGLEVYDTGGVFIGEIIDIITTGGHDLFIVQQKHRENKQILIPAVNKFILEVKMAENTVIVKLPDGLLDL
ncbi:MAG: ribosome maturation factor RimM [Dethiobacteria bacterium]|nr:ribosome maturation factor RimM [Bacillota bacterium]